MKNKIGQYWNFKLLGIIVAVALVLKVSVLSVWEKIISFFWKFNFASSGKNLIIQSGSKIRQPRNIQLGDNVSIGRKVNLFSEFYDSKLIIQSGSQINFGVELDFSGGLNVGKNVMISEHAVIMSHDHGLDPHSKPLKKEKIIGDNVWIGARSIVLPQAQVIGNNSIIAAGSIVTKNVPDNVIVAGNPAIIIRQL